MHIKRSKALVEHDVNIGLTINNNIHLFLMNYIIQCMVGNFLTYEDELLIYGGTTRNIKNIHPCKDVLEYYVLKTE